MPETSPVVSGEPIINLSSASVVDSLPSKGTTRQEFTRGRTNENATILGGSTYDVRIDLSENRREVESKQNLLLRVDLELVGEGSFTSEADKLGVQSVPLRSSQSGNMSIVNSTKNLSGKDPNPIIIANTRQVTTYTPITILDRSKSAFLTVRVTATANYRPDV